MRPFSVHFYFPADAIVADLHRVCINAGWTHIPMLSVIRHSDLNPVPDDIDNEKTQAALHLNHMYPIRELFSILPGHETAINRLPIWAYRHSNLMECPPGVRLIIISTLAKHNHLWARVLRNMIGSEGARHHYRRLIEADSRVDLFHPF